MVSNLTLSTVVHHLTWTGCHSDRVDVQTHTCNIALYVVFMYSAHQKKPYDETFLHPISGAA